MKESVKASQAGLDLVYQAARRKGWNKVTTSAWWDAAHSSQSTLRRFWRRLPIRTDAFQAICQAVGVDWQLVVETDEIEGEGSGVLQTGQGDDTWVGRANLVEQLVVRVKGATRVVAISGITGIGKTALAEQLTLKLRPTFAKVLTLNFDSQDTLDFASSATQLLNQGAITLDSENAQDGEQLLNHLVSQLRSQRFLVIIDSLEYLLQGNEETGWNDFRDVLWLQFFQKLMVAPDCQSRLILTSQDLPSELERLGERYLASWYCQLLQGLDEAEQIVLFEKVGLGFAASSPEFGYLTRIGKAYEGHPLALRVIIGEITTAPFNRNVIAYWNEHGQEIEEVEKAQQQESLESPQDDLRLDRYSPKLRRIVNTRIEQSFKRLQQELNHAYYLLCLGAVYRRAVPKPFWLRTLQVLGLNEVQQKIALEALCDRYLLEGEIIDHQLHFRQHNLIRSVALVHLKALET